MVGTISVMCLITGFHINSIKSSDSSNRDRLISRRQVMGMGIGCKILRIVSTWWPWY
jgi:hypothetical protein